MTERTSMIGRAIRTAHSMLRRPSVIVRLALAVVVATFLVRPLISRVGPAVEQLQAASPWLTTLGLVLQIASLLCYSTMTRSALGDERGDIGLERLFRIQLVSRAVSSTLPGGFAAGPATGYHLMSSAGISGRNASASLASGSVMSAFVLNLILWVALTVSVPTYGFNAIYAAAAVLGVVLMLLVAFMLVAIVDGSAVLERRLRFIARALRINDDRVIRSIKTLGHQIQALLDDRPLISRLAGWAALNWLFDALSLWVFLQVVGVTMNPVGLLVAFGVANVLAVIPISPGGVGIVEWAHITILITFGASLEQATVAVVSYRIAQFLFPIALGLLAYISLALERWNGRRRSTESL